MAQLLGVSCWQSMLLFKDGGMADRFASLCRLSGELPSQAAASSALAVVIMTRDVMIKSPAKILKNLSIIVYLTISQIITTFVLGGRNIR